jgi:hypothetical protein
VLRKFKELQLNYLLSNNPWLTYGSTKFDNYLKRVKQLQEPIQTYFCLNNSKRSSSFVVPLYTKVPKLSNGGLVSREEFAKCYELCSKGLSPERIKIPKDVTMEEMHKCFGLVHNKNGYSYVFSEDPLVITKVESLWMVIHQNPFVLISRIISLAMARGVVMELNKKRKMNWMMYVEWTN